MASEMKKTVSEEEDNAFENLIRSAKENPLPYDAVRLCLGAALRKLVHEQVRRRRRGWVTDFDATIEYHAKALASAMYYVKNLEKASKEGAADGK